MSERYQLGGGGVGALSFTQWKCVSETPSPLLHGLNGERWYRPKHEITHRRPSGIVKTEHKSLRIKARKKGYFAKAFNEMMTTKKTQTQSQICAFVLHGNTPTISFLFSFLNIGSFLYVSSCVNILSY